jgi:phospholipase/carboxylesterase
MYEATITIPHKAVHLQKGEGKPLLLLAHGFADSGAGFVKRVAESVPDRFEVLAPNGLFPQPVRQGDTWKEAYAWYFADLGANKIYIHPAVSAGAVRGLVERLGLAARPKILVGFSQGGWFLPYLASELKNVERMIMIGAGFRSEDFARLRLRLPVSAIHGDHDEVVPHARSRDEFDRLGEWNTGGAFHLVPGMTHTIDDSGRARLRELLEG